MVLTIRRKRHSLWRAVYLDSNDLDMLANASSMNEQEYLFNYLEYPTDVVLLVVLWKLRYKLSLRDLAEMFLERGREFSYETAREWEARFTPLITEQLRTKRHGHTG